MPRQTERIREEALVISALKYCERDRPFFRDMISTTNNVPTKTIRLHAQGYLVAYRESYEEAIKKGFLPEENFFTKPYQEVCDYLEKYGAQEHAKESE